MPMNSAMDWAAYLENICSRQRANYDLKLQSLDAMSRMGLYVDVIRTIDIESVRPPQEVDMDVDVGRYVASVGLNGASAALLCKLPKFGFPIRAMREEQWGLAFSILRDYGSIELIRRAATFVRAGFAKAKRKQQQIVVEFDKSGFDFASDKLERSAYDSLGTEHLDATTLDGKQREIDALIEGCLRPWRTKFGTFIGYDALPEIDQFYFSLAEQQVYEWVDAAGFLPKTRVNKFTWEELTSVLVLISSIRMKHVNFVRVAKQTVPDLEILSSLTIWGPKEIKISEISWITGISAEKIHDILRVLYLQASEGHLLRNSTNTIHPLGVDFENGYYLYPVCGATNNPLTNFEPRRVCRRPFSLREWPYDRQEAEISLLARGA